MSLKLSLENEICLRSQKWHKQSYPHPLKHNTSQEVTAKETKVDHATELPRKRVSTLSSGNLPNHPSMNAYQVTPNKQTTYSREVNLPFFSQPPFTGLPRADFLV
jgi:hypothetical protein